jgi:filamentous hemagglutinin
VKVGETLFSDSFVSPDTGKVVGRIYLNQDITRHVYSRFEEAKNMPTLVKDAMSQKNGRYDLKSNYPGHEGDSYHGFKFNGKYISLRDAGNILAGMNAKSHEQALSEYMKGAGAYQKGGAWGAIQNKATGKVFGKHPYYGEQDYTGRAVEHGYRLNPDANESK